MKTIEVKIPELGNANGTCKWVAEKLEQLSKSLELSQTKSGVPCLTYESPIEKDKDNKPKRYVFCKPRSVYDEGFRLYEGMSVIHSVDNEFTIENGVFIYLTPKAANIVDDFIMKVADEFISKLNEL